MFNIVIVDHRVHVHNILNSLPKSLENSKEGKEFFISKSWDIILNKPTPRVFNHNSMVIVVDDCPPYWRVEECDKLGLPKYKGDRKSKTDDFWLVSDIGYSKNFPVVKSRGFEADDIAGCIHREVKKQFPNGKHGDTLINTWYWTVDGDWLQLVDDKSRQYFYSTLFHWGYFFSENDVVKFQKKRGVEINKPYDIVDYKSEMGDPSDNLPANTPRHIIDLLEPPYRPPTGVLEGISNLLTPPLQPNIDFSTYRKAIRQLSKAKLLN